MHSLKITLLIILISQWIVSFSQQIPVLANENYIESNYIFVNDINVREKPSLKSKILNTLPENYNFSRCHKLSGKFDTINGVMDYWIPIKNNNNPGFIWNKTVSINSFKSLLNLNQKFLINFSSKQELGFKIFENNKLIYKTFFSLPKIKNILGVYSLGKTHNSNENEILAVVINHENYKLYQWNGKEIKEFNKNLKDDYFLTGNYQKFTKGIINSKGVNIRAEPNVNSNKITTLNTNKFVEIIDVDSIRKKDKINDQNGSWYKIKWDNEIAYVWSKFLSVPLHIIQNNINIEESFLYTNKGIYVIKNKKIIAQYIFEYNEYERLFYDKGNLGLNENYHFLALKYFGESCGTYSGEKLFLWNGKTISYIGSSGGVGDGGFYEEGILIFPNNNKGIKDKIIRYSSSGESHPAITSGSCNSDYKAFLCSEKKEILKIKRDSLIAVSSKFSKMRESVKKTYPNHSIFQYEYGDINKDGIEDVVCSISETEFHTSYEVCKKPILLIMFGESNGNFAIKYKNSSIIKDNYVALDIEFINFDLVISVVYNSGLYFEDLQNDESPLTSVFTFSFNKTDNKLYWTSINNAEYLIDRESWKNNFSNFKTNKIEFSKAWAE